MQLVATQLYINHQSKGYDSDDSISDWASCDTMRCIEYKENMQGGVLNYDRIETYPDTNHGYELYSFILHEPINDDDPLGVYEYKSHSFENHLLNKYRIEISQQNLETLEKKIKVVEEILFLEKEHKKLIQELIKNVDKYKKGIMLYERKNIPSIYYKNFVKKYHKNINLNDSIKSILNKKWSRSSYFADISIKFE